jgi:hypothetical protein
MKTCTCVLLAGCCLFTFLPTLVQGGDALNPVNLDKLNTEADEDDPCPLPDGITLLYAAKVRGSFDIYLSRRTSEKAAWPAGKAMEGLASAEFDERTPFFHKASKMLYYAMNQAPEGAEDKNFDLVRKLGETGAVPLQGVSTKEDEFAPFVTPLGKEFYFSRMTRKGWSLYAGNGPVPGPIGEAKSLGFPPGFHRAALAPSGLLMYLQGPVSKDDEDEKTALFRSRRAKVGAPWSKPEPIPGLEHAESKFGDSSPSVSPDGTRLYFASDRPGGKGGLDVWGIQTAMLKK